MISPYVVVGLKPSLIDLTPDVIIEAVCGFYKLDKDILSQKGTRKLSKQRSIASALIRQHCGLTLVSVAALFYPAIAENDHTNTAHAVKRFTDWNRSEKFRKDVSEIMTIAFILKIKKQSE